MAQGITLEKKKNTKVHASTIKLSCLIVFMSLLCLFSVLFITRAEAAPLNPNHLVYVPPIDDFITGDKEYASYTLAYMYGDYVVISQGVFIPNEFSNLSDVLDIGLYPYGDSYRNRIQMDIKSLDDLMVTYNDPGIQYWQRTIVYRNQNMNTDPSSTIFSIDSAPYSWYKQTLYVNDFQKLTWESMELNNPYNWGISPSDIVSGATPNFSSHLILSNLFLSDLHNIDLNYTVSTYLEDSDKRGRVAYTDSYYEWLDYWYTKHAHAQNNTQAQYLAGILDALNQANANDDFEATVPQSQLDKAEALKSEQQYQDDFVNDNKQALDDVDTSLDTTDLTNYFSWLNNSFFITMLISSLTIAIVFFSLFGGR